MVCSEMSAKEITRNSESGQKATRRFRNVGGFLFNKFKSKSKIKTDPVESSEKKTKKNFFSIFDRSEKLEQVVTIKNNSVEHMKKVADEREYDKENNLTFKNNSSENHLRIPDPPAPPLNNSMAKSKIRAASKKKPSKRNPMLARIPDCEPMKIIDETQTSTVSELKQLKRSDSTRFDRIEEEIKLNKSNPIDREVRSLHASTENIALRPVAYNQKPYNLKDSKINMSSENLIENAKKSLKSVRHIPPESDIIKSSKNTGTPKKFLGSNYKLAKESNESLGISQNTENSDTSMTMSSIRCLSMCSSSNSSVEKLNKTNRHAPSYEQGHKFHSGVKYENKPIPIYDNFTLPEAECPRVHKQLDKSNSAPEYKSSKQQKEDPDRAINKDPGNEFQDFIKSKLKNPECMSQNQPFISGSFEQLNKVKNKCLEPRTKKQDENNEKCDQTRKLTHSKSLKLDQEFQENKAEFKAKKVVLINRNENGQIDCDESGNRVPLKRVSDLIRNLNNQQNLLEVPAWRDMALKKKNSWIQQNSVENMKDSGKKSFENDPKFQELNHLLIKPTNKVKSIIMGLEESTVQ